MSCELLAQVATAAFVCCFLVKSTHGSLDNNPELGHYQDDGQCTSWNETWYIVYRNYEVDPYHGDSTHCANATQIGFDDETTSIITEEKGKETWYAKCRLTSSPGYTRKNLVLVTNAAPVPWLEASKQPQVNFTMTAAYVDCNNCKVFHQDYIDGGCTLWKPESKINEENPCCEFIYDLLCGTSPKYHISKNCNRSFGRFQSRLVNSSQLRVRARHFSEETSLGTCPRIDI